VKIEIPSLINKMYKLYCDYLLGMVKNMIFNQKILENIYVVIKNSSVFLFSPGSL